MLRQTHGHQKTHLLFFPGDSLPPLIFKFVYVYLLHFIDSAPGVHLPFIFLLLSIVFITGMQWGGNLSAVISQVFLKTTAVNTFSIVNFNFIYFKCSELMHVCKQSTCLIVYLF